MKSILATLHQIREERRERGFTIFDIAPQSALTDIEQQLGRKLPTEIHAFYSQCGGFWDDEDLFRILSPADILKEIRHTGIAHPDQLRFPIADYMIFSDTWDLLLDKQDSEMYHIVNNNHKTEQDVVLTSSLTEFIDRFLAEGVFGKGENDGLYGWRESIKAQTDSLA